MSERLNVIALISGGKDSFYSLIHCVQNGHKVVALGNLHPKLPSSNVQPTSDNASKQGDLNTDRGGLEDASRLDESDHIDQGDEEKDLNSFMYQTVGHTVIPLYEKALGIPLYRQEILGRALETGTSYREQSQVGSQAKEPHNEDETESLVPLLGRIMAAHPEANAICTGAILSTYQRTRIESVALRLGLVPLSFLWQYPVLPPATQISLLQDMSSVSLDARIIKVASGGLDEEFLWENVAGVRGMTRVEKAMKRFGNDGDGSVIGEGGEFETLVVDGPDWLFKGRIEVDATDRRIVREGGGAAWLAMGRAKVVMKEGKTEERSQVRMPNLLDGQFERSLSELGETPLTMEDLSIKNETPRLELSMSQRTALAKTKDPSSGIPSALGIHWTIASSPSDIVESVNAEITSHVQNIKTLLAKSDRLASDIIFALIILRSMDDFVVINKIYGSLFTEPNPPARVTIASGDTLLGGQHVMIHLTLRGEQHLPDTKRALHVQSRSYWAPANIGPYSQAISVPQSNSSPSTFKNRLVHVAGQIPLIPGTMTLPNPSPTSFELQTILSLQHLWRIGVEMDISWWTSAVAFLPRDTLVNLSNKARIAGKVWDTQFRRSDEDQEDEERDLWEEKHRGGFGGVMASSKKSLPNWDSLDSEDAVPPFFAAEVETLPRDSGIEWYAHLGVVGAGIKVSSEGERHGATKYVCDIGNSLSQTVLLVSWSGFFAAPKMLETIRGSIRGDGSDAVEIYTDTSLWVPGNIQGVIPCRSLWDKDGGRLAAVFIARNCN